MVEVAVEVGVDGALHPYVDGECLKIGEAEEGDAGGDFVADTLDGLERFEGVGIAGVRFYIAKVDLVCGYFFCRVEYVSVAETGLGG